MHQLGEYLRSKLSGAVLIPQGLPNCGSLRLALLDPTFPQSQLTREEQYNLLCEPLYWIFCWPAGVGLAQRIYQQPDLVRGKVVLDFGAGSGVLAVMAALSGASKVYALDSDRWARLAIEVNGKLNGVEISLLEELPADFRADLCLASDVLYDRENYPLLEVFPKIAPQILLADCRPADPRPANFHLLGCSQGAPVPDFDDFNEFAQYEIWSSGFFPESGVA